MSQNSSYNLLKEFKFKKNISAYTNLTDREKEIHLSAFMSGYKLGQDHMMRSRQKIKVIHVKSAQNKDVRLGISKMGNKQARDIFYKVINYYKRTEAEIISPRRLKEYAEVRSVIINLLRELTSLSLPEIGRIVGGRDHTTVLHHLRLKFDNKRFWSSGSPTWKYFDELKEEIEKEFSKS